MKTSIIMLLLLKLLCSSVIASEKPLNVITMALPPYGYIDENGLAAGINADIVSAIVKRSGLAFEHKIYPFARITKMLKAGAEVDITMALPHDNVTEFSSAVLPVIPIDIVIITRKGTVINNIEDLEGKVLGMVRGAKYDTRLSENSNIRKSM